MFLTKKQKQEIEKHDWDVITRKSGNVCVLKVYKEDGKIFKEICELYRLTAQDSVQLAVIATKEDE